MTPSENTRNWEKEKRRAGWKFVQVWLPPEAAKKLDAIVEKLKDSEDGRYGLGKAIEGLINEH